MANDLHISNHSFLPRKVVTSNPPGFLLGGFTARLPLTINHTVFAKSLVDFVLLIDITDTLLKHRSYGGVVTSLDGSGIAASSLDGSVAFPILVQSYNQVTGHLVAWIRIDLISHTIDTVFNLYMGSVTGSPIETVTEPTWAVGEELIVLGERSGDLIKDKTPARRSGTVLTGIVTQDLGLHDLPALNLSGTADFPPIGMNSDLTVSVWVKKGTNPGSGFGYLLSSVDPHSSQRFQVAISQDGYGPRALKVSLTPFEGTIDHVFPALLLDDGGWHHLIIIVDQTGLKVYLDGSLIGSALDGVNHGIETDAELTLGGLANGSGRWYGTVSMLRCTNASKDLAVLSAERSTYLSPDTITTKGIGLPVPPTASQETYLWEVPISLNGPIDLNHVYSDYNVFFQRVDQPVVHWVNAPIGIPEYLLLKEWQQLGQDLHSAIGDMTNPEVAANVDTYLEPSFYGIKETIAPPCCARFLFCIGPIDANPCNPSLPVFVQHTQSGDSLGWSQEMPYTESEARLVLRTFCGPCNNEGLLATLPVAYP